MREEMLEKVLACPSLPSLPAVALRVIELASNNEVALKELTSTIEKDQGLSAKVLRTVNSSFYAVRTKCATISKALVLLGLGPVRALSLGFSLVSAVADEGDAFFDYKAYWRRGLYTGVSAKCFAEAAKLRCGEEAFLGGLLQDVGMVAMRRALGRQYLDILAQTGGDHGKLAALELDQLELNHAEIGAMLAKRWKLPDELIMPVKYHERPTAAPQENIELVRCVGIGNLAHDVLTDPDPTAAARRLYSRCEEWLGLAPSKVDDTMKRVGTAVREMSSLFSLDTGAAKDAEEILKKANTQLAELAKAAPAAARGEDGMAGLLKGSEFDPLTGVLARKGFDGALRKAFAEAATNKEPVALVQVAIDGFKAVAEQFEPHVGDEIIVGTAALLKKHFEPSGGVVCRLTNDIFATVLTGASTTQIMTASEEFRKDVLRARESWGADSAKGKPNTVSVSVGVAAKDPAAPGFDKPEQIVIAAAKAVQEARAAGGNRAQLSAAKAA